VAQRALTERNIFSYLPQCAQWPRPVVGGAIAPLFPGYLFVHAALADVVARIAWTPGIKDFVRSGAEPASVDDSVIALLRSREGPDGVIRYNERARSTSEVRIVRGPFRGLTAIVEERLPARERVQVLMYLLHRSTRVELPETWLRQA
jgi:transcriptional antiterminator RfaH